MEEEWTSNVTALVVLPKLYNPDRWGRRRQVEAAKFRATCIDITGRFGGCILHEDPKTGYWEKAGIIFEDDVEVLEVDMVDAAEERQWIIDYARNVLLERFKQEAIYIKFVRFVEVEMVEVRR